MLQGYFYYPLLRWAFVIAQFVYGSPDVVECRRVIQVIFYSQKRLDLVGLSYDAEPRLGDITFNNPTTV